MKKRNSDTDTAAHWRAHSPTQRVQCIVSSRQPSEKRMPSFTSRCGSYFGEGQKASRDISGCSVLGAACVSVRECTWCAWYACFACVRVVCISVRERPAWTPASAGLGAAVLSGAWTPSAAPPHGAPGTRLPAGLPLSSQRRVLSPRREAAEGSSQLLHQRTCPPSFLSRERLPPGPPRRLRASGIRAKYLGVTSA